MPHPLSVRCPQCQAKLKLKSRKAVGKKTPCPKCGHQFVVQPVPPEAEPGPLESLSEGEPELPPAQLPRRGGRWRSAEDSHQDEAQAWLLPAVIAGSVLAGIGVIVTVVFWTSSGEAPDSSSQVAADSTSAPASKPAEPPAAPDNPQAEHNLPNRTNAFRSDLLPPDSELIASIRLRELWNSPLIQTLKQDPALAPAVGQFDARLSATGFSPEDVQRLSVGVGGLSQKLSNLPATTPATLMSTDASVVIRTRKPIELQQVLDFARQNLAGGRPFETAQVNGTTCYQIPLPTPAVKNAGSGSARPPSASLFLADDRTLVICSEAIRDSIVNAKPTATSDFGGNILDDDAHVLLVFRPEENVPVNESLPSGISWSPALLNQLRSISLTVTAGEENQLSLDGQFADTESSQQAADQIESLLQSSREQFRNWKNNTAPEQFAQQWAVLQKLMDGVTVSKTDDIVQVTASLPNAEIARLKTLPRALSSLGMPGATRPQAGVADLNGFKPEPPIVSGTISQQEESAAEDTSQESSSEPAEELSETSLRKRIILTYDKPFGLFPPDDSEPLFATLELTGKPAAEATHYGFLKLSAVTLDGGESLEPVESPFGMDSPADQFLEVNRDMMFAGQSEKPEDKIRMHVMLSHPPADGQKLGIVDGSLQLLTGGERKQVIIPNVASKTGDQLSGPALQQADLEIQNIDPADAQVTLPDSDPEHMVALEIQGPQHAILDVELVDQRGKVLETQAAWSNGLSAKETLSYTLRAERKITPAISLRLEVAVGQRRVRVPFHFESIPLPKGPGQTTSRETNREDAPTISRPGTERTRSPNELNPESLLSIQSAPRARLNLRGHLKGVTGIAFSPDGKSLASAGERGKIKVWDLQTSDVRTTFENHEGPVRCVTFSPDGRRIASVGDDRTVRLWNPENGKQTRVFRGHWNDVLTAEFSPDGSRLATGGRDWTVRLWDVDSGDELGTLKGHAGWVHSVAFSPDGNWLASAAPRPKGKNSGGEVIVWDLNAEIPTQITYGEHRNVDIVSRKVVTRITGHPRGAESVAFLSDGSRLVSGSRLDGTVRLWAIPAGTEIKQLTNVMSPIAVAPDVRLLAVNGGDGRVQLHDAQTGDKLIDWQAHEQDVTSITLMESGAALATVGNDGIVKVWPLTEDWR